MTTTTSTCAVLEAALDYARRGWFVFPLYGAWGGRCICGKRNCASPGKHPLTQHGLTDASTDESVIRQWFNRDAHTNVGIVTGASSGLLVIDVDPRHGGDETLRTLEAAHGRLPDTVESLTGGGGRHLLFRHLGEEVKNSSGKLGPGLDIKADGGYVVAPPSLHLSGRAYQWEITSGPDDVALADAPAWLLAKLDKNIGKAAAPPAPTGDTLVEGQRNAELTSLAGAMRRKGATQAGIEAALLAENARRCSPPLETQEVSRIAQSIAKYPTTPTVHATTDVGNAARFVMQVGADYRYCGPCGKWLRWDGARWCIDESLQVMRSVKAVALSIFDEAKQEADPERQKALSKWAITSQKLERLTAMVSLARCELAVAPLDLDTDIMLLNVLNGTMDLRTGKLRPHDRADLITKLAPVVFDASAPCPLWQSFLSRIMADNNGLIAYLQRIAGMCLTGDVREQVLFMFYGVGANGKSVLLDTLAGLLGGYAAEAAPDLLMDRRGGPEHPTELADLCGRRLVVTCETEEGCRLRVQLIKRLTGNARLKARYMRQDYFEFPRTHKLIVATNNKPVVRESTLAIWRRLRLIPFNVVIPEPEQDKLLLERLKADWPGILHWAIQGCLDWQEHGLQTPVEVTEATREYEDEQDATAEFVAAACILAPNAFTPRTDVFNSYQTWATANHERYPLGRNDLYARLRQRPGIADGQRRVGTSVLKGFLGLGLLATNPRETPNSLL